MQEQNRLKDVLVYGVDGSPEVKDLIKDGFIEGTVVQSPKTMGKETAEILYRILNKKGYAKSEKIEVTLITKENIHEHSLRRMGITMFSKITNTDKLHFTFLFMSFINFIIIIFIGSVMAITIQTVCDMDSAYIFLSRISHLPKNPYSVLLISILAFLFLLVMMWIRRKQEITSVRLGVWFAVEIVLCMIIMEELSFSTNAI